MRYANIFSATVASLLLVAPVSAQAPQNNPPAAQPYGYGMGPAMMGGYGYGPMMGGYGMMGPGMMGGYGMMGPGMMGQGMMGGYGPMTGWSAQRPDLNISVDEAKTYFERWITMSGNSRVKVGKVAATNNDTITVDIVTTDKEGLVQRYVIDRHTGFMRQGE